MANVKIALLGKNRRTSGIPLLSRSSQHQATSLQRSQKLILKENRLWPSSTVSFNFKANFNKAHTWSVHERTRSATEGSLNSEKFGLELNYDKNDENKVVDMVTLGNLCVDVLVQVEFLPPSDRAGKWEYMQKLKASTPDEIYWEGGGMANTLIAGGRLGLRCIALGHVGDDKFGHFFEKILADEGVSLYDVAQGGAAIGGDDYHGETLIVWVMVGPTHEHAFCSRFDFNSNPVFSRLTRLPSHTEHLLAQSKSLFINGFTFDEFPFSGVLSAAQLAKSLGSAVLFDPGPRTPGLLERSGEELWKLLRICDVVLLTSDEAEVLTGINEPTRAAQKLLEDCGENTKWVVVKKGAEGCVMATQMGGMYSIPGFKVDLVDSVGCGDSFAAALTLGYTRGESPSVTLALANAVGAATATGSGAGRNVAKAELVEEILTSLQAESDKEYGCETCEGNGNGYAKYPNAGSLSHLVNGSPVCPSGVPMHIAVQGALSLLRRSLTKHEGL